MVCQLCVQDKKLIKAHIIPEFFYKNLKIYQPDRWGQNKLFGFQQNQGITRA
jgi:hypothetical protein